MKQRIRLYVNEEHYELEVEQNHLLVDALRKDLGLTGTKKGCNIGVCGACTVLVEGRPVSSCLTLAVSAQGKSILTIEGLARSGKLHPIQRSFLEHGGFQCGYCTPGMILAAKALLDENPNPSEDEIREGMAGNLCRCTGYYKILDSIKALVGT